MSPGARRAPRPARPRRGPAGDVGSTGPAGAAPPASVSASAGRVASLATIRSRCRSTSARRPASSVSSTAPVYGPRAGRPPATLRACSPTAAGSARTCRSAAGMVKAADRAAEIGADDDPGVHATTRQRGAAGRPPRGAAARSASGSTARTSRRSRSTPRTSSTSPGPTPTFHEQSIAVLANELRVAQGVRRGVRQRPHRVAPGRWRRGRASRGSADGHRARALSRGRGRREAPAMPRRRDRRSRTAPAAGSAWATTIEELAGIDSRRLSRGVPPTGSAFCLDTAHLWGAGYDIDTPAGVDGCSPRSTRAIGLDRLAMVHLNDSRSEPGSRADRHEHVGAGRIGETGSRRLLSHPRLAHVAVHPRDARHGRGLRRDQCHPRRGPRRRPSHSTRCPAAALHAAQRRAAAARRRTT